MSPTSIFQLMAGIFQQTGAQVVLIGGYAINFHHVARQTNDVDFMIDRQAFEPVRIALENIGFEITFSHEVFAQFASRDYPFLGVDFMFVDTATITRIEEQGQSVTIAGVTFVVPSLMHLIALKLHSIKHNPRREYKDLPDILSLIKANDIDVDGPELGEVCAKHGTPRLLVKIQEFLR